MDMPKDAAMLLSFINLKLRDFYDSLDALCEDLDADKENIKSTLATIDYFYNEDTNRFE